MKLPAKLVGIAIGADGRPLGLDLPSLDARGAAEAWRLAIGPGPYYARFEDRSVEPSLDRVQRLGRIGEVWLDCAMDGVDGALDLLIAGASRLVLWGDDPDLIEAVGDSAVVGWDGTKPLGDAFAAAAPHRVPVLATAPATDVLGNDPTEATAEDAAEGAAQDTTVGAAPTEADPQGKIGDGPVAVDPQEAGSRGDQVTVDPQVASLYQAPPRPWTGLFDVPHVGTLGDDDEDDGDDE